MLDFFTSLGSAIMTPLYYVVSGVLVGWHSVLGAIFGPESGAAWALSIVGLTIVIRAALIPLFVKQIKSSRNMQLIQPRVKELQKKYGHDRERMAAETMSLYKETGTNPFSSCLPLLVQMPIFFALFRLIDHAAKNQEGHGFLTDKLALSFANAPFFGGTLANSFTNDGGSSVVKVIAAVLVLIMTATTFLTQRQLMTKNMPADAMTGQYAQQQKMLLYVLPVVFGVGGIAFPIGVVLYWTTSNFWTMSQQFYVIRNNPSPNTEAFAAKVKRDAEKRKRKGLPENPEAEGSGEDNPGLGGSGAGGVPAKGGPRPGNGSNGGAAKQPPQRQQPQSKSRSQRKKTKPGPQAGRPGLPKETT